MAGSVLEELWSKAGELRVVRAPEQPAASHSANPNIQKLKAFVSFWFLK